MKELFTALAVSILGIVWASQPGDNITDIDIVPDYARDRLLKEGFVITPAHYKEFWDAYSKIEKDQHSPFITTDRILHATHLFFDRSLRTIEERRLFDDLDSLVSIMSNLSMEQYKRAKKENIKNLAKLNWAFFETAKKLLHPEHSVPIEVRELVAKEIKLIDAHEGPAPRPLLTYIKKPELKDYAIEDYSQYVPRGHYTRSEKLSRYFKVMMFLGRMDFKLRPGDDPEAIADGKNMTIQALLITDALHSNRTALKLWREIYGITSFFVGAADDLTPQDYYPLLKDIFGGGKPDKFAKDSKLEEFIQRAEKLRKPQIASNMVVIDSHDSRHKEISTATQGFRFMGQRSIPDSYIFQKLVWGGGSSLKYTGKGKPFTMEVIPNVGPARAFPRGLDVMAVLGCDAALKILKKSGDTEYTDFDKIFTQLRQQFADLPDSVWHKSLYWRWFDALRSLCKIPRGISIPRFMKSALWKIKALLTALGSWTELRHDTILYAKQSYTPMAKAMPPMPPQVKRNPRGYVEPYPQLYHKINDMMASLSARIDSFGMDELTPLKDRIGRFRRKLDFLASVSERELAGKSLTKDDYDKLRHFGSELSSLLDFSDERSFGVSPADERCDAVADVHTVQFKRQVLEEAIGAPFDIYVLVGEGGETRVCHGAVFSYYEFKWDMADRLTDEKWQKMRHRHRSFMPDWVRQLVVSP